MNEHFWHGTETVALYGIIAELFMLICCLWWEFAFNPLVRNWTITLNHWINSLPSFKAFNSGWEAKLHKQEYIEHKQSYSVTIWPNCDRVLKATVGSRVGMGIENRFLFRTGSQWTDSLESLAKFFSDSANGSLCHCACANLLIQTAANMLAFWITSDWGEWDWWWNNSCPFSPTQLFWFSDRLLASELAANPGLTCRVVMCLSLNLSSQ